MTFSSSCIIVHTYLQHCPVHSCALWDVHLPSVGRRVGLDHFTIICYVDPTWCLTGDLEEQRLSAGGEDRVN